MNICSCTMYEEDLLNKFAVFLQTGINGPEKPAIHSVLAWQILSSSSSSSHRTAKLIEYQVVGAEDIDDNILSHLHIKINLPKFCQVGMGGGAHLKTIAANKTGLYLYGHPTLS